jgi:hypothetical protein
LHNSLPPFPLPRFTLRDDARFLNTIPLIATGADRTYAKCFLGTIAVLIRRLSLKFAARGGLVGTDAAGNDIGLEVVFPEDG